jgi:uncharacterized damage-inducible protein DinB
MSTTEKREVWLRGPLPGIPALLQPVAHALLQAREELNDLAKDFPDNLLWERPAGLASAAFHLQHLSGVLDRLFTYANGRQLSPTQLTALAAEGIMQNDIHCIDLVNRFNTQVDIALTQLKNTPEQTLLEQRAVGRGQIPSTVIGLLVHAAEHTQRHIGQLLVTMRVVKG